MSKSKKIKSEELLCFLRRPCRRRGINAYTKVFSPRRPRNDVNTGSSNIGAWPVLKWVKPRPGKTLGAVDKGRPMSCIVLFPHPEAWFGVVDNGPDLSNPLVCELHRAQKLALG
jgi:hypothetical protein